VTPRGNLRREIVRRSRVGRCKKDGWQTGGEFEPLFVDRAAEIASQAGRFGFDRAAEFDESDDVHRGDLTLLRRKRTYSSRVKRIPA
jgi:hypothetical protein